MIKPFSVIQRQGRVTPALSVFLRPGPVTPALSVILRQGRVSVRRAQNLPLSQLRIPLIAGLTSLSLTLGGMLAWSLWSDRGTSDGSINSATGYVDAEAGIAESVWRRSTPGYDEWSAASDNQPYQQPCGPIVPNTGGAGAVLTALCTDPGTGEPIATEPSEVVTMPGDTFEYLMPMATDLLGQNLVAGFTVTVNDPEVAVASWNSDTGQWENGDLAFEFYVADPLTLQRLVPALDQRLAHEGEILVLPELISGGASVVKEYVLVARAMVLGNYVWASDFAGDISGRWTMGNITFALTQVRPQADSAPISRGGEGG